jgi:hypothetical protein
MRVASPRLVRLVRGVKVTGGSCSRFVRRWSGYGRCGGG